MEVDDLHDAVLNKVSVDAEEGCIRLDFEPVQFENAPQRIVLMARQFNNFVFPRKQPWGLVRFWCINEVRGPFSLGPKLQRLEIEMQSGDVIELHANNFERIEEFGHTP